MRNLSGRIFFQEKVKFLKSGIWFQFYASNKDTQYIYCEFFFHFQLSLIKSMRMRSNQGE